MRIKSNGLVTSLFAGSALLLTTGYLLRKKGRYHRDMSKMKNKLLPRLRFIGKQIRRLAQ